MKIQFDNPFRRSPIRIEIGLDDRSLKSLESLIMSKLSDKLASIDGKVDGLTTDVADLATRVNDAPTDDDLAKLDGIDGKIDALKASVIAIGTQPPPNPEPTPEPVPPPA